MLRNSFFHLSITLAALFTVLLLGSAQAIRLKDVAAVEGVRDNQLQGVGLVIGLNGTGDGTSNRATAQTLTSLLKRNGINAQPDDVKPKNIAIVSVTATLPAFARPGSRIDVLVNSLGDATNLQGGTLLMTPLHAPNGNVYAVAQGPLSLGGFGVSAGGNQVQKNHTTVAMIPNGALVERGVNISLEEKETIHILLNNPDFTTAARIAKAVNTETSSEIASPVDSGTVAVNVPSEWDGRIVDFIAQIEGVPVHPDQRARIIMDERTGTVIMGEDVRISTVAIAHGDLTFQVSQFNQMVQPGPFAPRGAVTALEENQTISAQEQEVQLSVVPEGVSLSEVVSGLNALGVTARDLIAILQSIKASGALQAEIEIR